MTLIRLTNTQVRGLRDNVEEMLAVHTARAVRKFLRQVTDEALADTRTSVLLAAGSSTDPLTLGQMRGWWAAVVDQDITDEIRAAFMVVYRATRDGVVTQTSIDRLDEYTANVTDRLVQGLTPPLPEDAFNRVRVAVTQAAAEGWSRPQLASRIAAELSWETKGPYWRTELTRIDGQIDSILDPLGQPGHPLREAARLNDPRVVSLRADRNGVIKALEAEKSHWRTRADLIARTEATAANGYASLSALNDEGVEGKTWLATEDGKTRTAHRPPTDGQTVLIDQPFMVDGYEMQMPGDTSAPVRLTANCRCCMVGAI